MWISFKGDLINTDNVANISKSEQTIYIYYPGSIADEWLKDTFCFEDSQLADFAFNKIAFALKNGFRFVSV